jgi:hypothetical protein
LSTDNPKLLTGLQPNTGYACYSAAVYTDASNNVQYVCSAVSTATTDVAAPTATTAALPDCTTSPTTARTRSSSRPPRPRRRVAPSASSATPSSAASGRSPRATSLVLARGLTLLPLLTWPMARRSRVSIPTRCTRASRRRSTARQGARSTRARVLPRPLPGRLCLWRITVRSSVTGGTAAVDGSLTGVTSTSVAGSYGIAISGTTAYVTNVGGNSVTQCTIDGTSLTGCATMTTTGTPNFNFPSGIAISGTTAYVTNYPAIQSLSAPSLARR